MKILFFSSNPNRTGILRLDKEFWEIRGSIAVSRSSKNVFIQFVKASKLKLVQDLIEREKPDIVHFSGHGNKNGEIVLEDKNRNPLQISPETFASIFRVNENPMKCVVLNCCYSEKAAKLINRIVDCVIGIKTDIDDQLAIAFASAFYLALGERKNLQIAFDFAINEFFLKGGLIEQKPQLFIQSKINPWETFLIKEN